LLPFLKKNVYLPIEVYMFKNFRALSAFVGLVALFFASAVSLATCSGGGEEEGRPSSSSKPIRSSTTTFNDPDVNASINQVEIGFSGSSQEYLSVIIGASITIDGSESRFDSVLITLEDDVNGVRLLNGNRKTSESRGFYWDTRDDVDGGKINVSDERYCGSTFNVCVDVFANGNALPVEHECSEKITREEARCRPPSSSSEQSSSSAVSIPLTPVSFGGEQTFRINQNTGVNLGTGAGAPTSSAHIYYSPNPANRLVAGPGVKIMQEFNDPECGCFQFTAVPTGTCGSVPNPASTSDFFAPCGAEGAYIDPYMPYNYYLVKTNSETSWSSGWYIVVSTTTPAQAAGTTGIEIKAWKVN
jgi:hypothetical protein